MYKKAIMLLFFLFLLLSGSIFASNNNVILKTLMIYDTNSFFGEYQNIPRGYENALSHFNTQVDKKNEREYTSGEVLNYDVVILLNIQNSIKRKELLDDLEIFEGKIIWVGNSCIRDSLFIKLFSMEFKETKYDINNLVAPSYQNGKATMVEVSIDFGQKITIYNILDEERSKVLVWSDYGGQLLPYIVKSENGIYVGSTSMNKALYNVMLNSLHEIYTAKDVQKKQVFLRLEDVHPMADQKKLREIADYLYSENIPFMVAVIPAFQKSDEPDDYILISQVDGFPETIQYLQEHGGTVVLHGFTHTVFGMDDSGEGYEFWDGDSNLPLEKTYGVQMEDFVTDRLGRALHECVKNGIYPLAFEAPHYAASQEAYRSFGQYFSTYCGHLQTSDTRFSTTQYPYVLKNTKHFEKVIPENLGYIEIDDINSYKNIKDNLKEGSLVRDFFGGAFYHPYLGLEPLKPLVKILKESGYSFYDMKNDEHRVKMEGIEIQSYNGKIKVKFEKYVETTSSKINKNFEIIIYVVIWFLIFVIIIYYIIIQKLKYKNHKRER